MYDDPPLYGYTFIVDEVIDFISSKSIKKENQHFDQDILHFSQRLKMMVNVSHKNLQKGLSFKIVVIIIRNIHFLVLTYI